MDLMKYLPDYYSGNLTMEELQGILSHQINSIADSKNHMIDQCFISYASSLLSRYEKIYAIDTDVSQGNQVRIEKIKAKILSVGTTTKEMIQNMAAAYSNGEVVVIEDNENYRFTIKFVGEKGIPNDIDALAKSLNEIKPAHLELEFSYTFNTWNDVSIATWAQANEFTWKETREGTGWPNTQLILI